MQRRGTILLWTGLSILTLGIVFGVLLFPYVLEKKIKQQIRLEEDGELYNKWVDVKIPIFMKVYFFKITNIEDFVSGKKPILEEVGPYVYEYEQKRQKVVLVTHRENQNDTLQFRPKITYYFREDLSDGRKESDVIPFINVPYVSIVSKAVASPFLSVIVRDLMDEFDQQLFVNRTVAELLFKGTDEPVIRELSLLKGEELMPDNRFGFYYGKNGTEQDLLEIYSGIVNNEKFGETISWNGNEKLDIWGSEYCNMINGSDGSIFPPFVTRDRYLRIFSPDMCRSIYMTYTEDVNVGPSESLSIPAYRFTTPKEVLGDAREFPENVCYCTEPRDDELSGCTKSGVFRIGPCRKGAPIVASWPHFYEGDPEYVSQSIGLNPQKALHETFLSLEPNTGALLEASKRFQVNIELKPTRLFPTMKKIPKMILPLLWADESVSLTEENAEMLKKKLLKPLKIGSIVMFALMGIGSLLIVVGLVLMCTQKKTFKPSPTIYR